MISNCFTKLMFQASARRGKLVLPAALLFFFVLATEVARCAPFYTPDKSEIETLSRGWVARWGDAGDQWFPVQNVFQGVTGPGRNGARIVWLKRTVPELRWDEPTLKVTFPIMAFELYVGGERRFASRDISDIVKNALTMHDPGHAFYLVPLRNDDSGKELQLRFYSTRNLIGVWGPIQLGSRTNLLGCTVTDDTLVLVSTVLFLGLGLAVLLLYFVNPREISYLTFAIATASSGLHFLTRTDTKQLLMSDIELWRKLELFSLYVMITAFTLFWRVAFGKGPLRIHTLLSAASATMLVTSIVAAPLGIEAIQMLPYFQALAALGIAYFLIYFPALAWRGDIESRYLFSGCVGFIALLAVELLDSLSVIYLTQRVGVLGVMCLIGGMGSILVRRFSLTYAKVKHLKSRLEILLDRARQLATIRDPATAIGLTASTLLTESPLLAGLPIVLMRSEGSGCQSYSLSFPDKTADSHSDSTDLNVGELKQIDGRIVVPVQPGKSALVVATELSETVRDELQFAGSLASSLATTLDNFDHLRDAVEKAHLDAALKREQNENRIIRELSGKMQIILDNIEHGIVTFDSSLQIEEGYSALFNSMFGVVTASPVNQSLMNTCFKSTDFSNDDINRIEQTLVAVIGADTLAWDVNRHGLPWEGVFHVNGSRLEFGLEWTPIFGVSGEITKVMLVVTDLTKSRELESKVKKYNAENAILLSVVHLTLEGTGARLKDFLNKSEAATTTLIGAVNKGAFDVPLAFREMHTIKGTGRTLDLKAVSDCAHDAEEILHAAREGQPFSSEALRDVLAALLEQLQAFSAVYGKVTERGGADPHAASSLLRFVGDHSLLMKRNLENGSGVFGAVHCLDDVIDWSPEFFSTLTMMLVHALNNSVDHGYVLPIARGRVLEPARFVVRAEIAEHKILVFVEDHGDGISLEKLEDLARKRDALSVFASNPTEVLFLDGASTADKVTVTSGRGVGLSAVRQMARDLGGNAWLEIPGQRGSRLVISAPLSVAVEDNAVSRLAQQKVA